MEEKTMSNHPKPEAKQPAMFFRKQRRGARAGFFKGRNGVDTPYRPARASAGLWRYTDGHSSKPRARQSDKSQTMKYSHRSPSFPIWPANQGGAEQADAATVQSIGLPELSDNSAGTIAGGDAGQPRRQWGAVVVVAGWRPGSDGGS